MNYEVRIATAPKQFRRCAGMVLAAFDTEREAMRFVKAASALRSPAGCTLEVVHVPIEPLPGWTLLRAA